MTGDDTPQPESLHDKTVPRIPIRNAEGDRGEPTRIRESPTPDRSEATAYRRKGAAAISEGTLLAGRWEVVSLLGTGGEGEVYRVSDRNQRELIERHRALKVVRHGVADARRIRAEVLAGEVGHQNLVRTIDFGQLDEEFGGCFYLVMDFIDGGTLANLIRAEAGSIDVNRARRLCVGILHGLDALHRRNIVHRDLKPTNILISASDGTDERPMLSDFGIAHATDGGQTILGGAGTLGYAAPEQIGGRANRASDVYSFGHIAFELLVGRRPRYGDPTLERLRPELPATVGRLIMECLNEDHNARPQNAAELLRLIESSWPARIEFAPGANGHRSEAVAQRLLESREYSKILEHVAIERRNDRSTFRLEWISAIANKSIGRNPDAFDCYKEALRRAGTPPADLRREFAAFLTALGRLEDAADQYQHLLAESTDNSTVREYLKILLELGRHEDAVDLAISRKVVPDIDSLACEVARRSVDLAEYSFAADCAAAIGEASEYRSDATAIAGISFFELGDLSRAELLLIDASGHAELGTRARRALWRCRIGLRSYTEATILADSLSSEDPAWMHENAPMLFASAIEAMDPVHLARLVRKAGAAPCPQDVIERGSAILSQFGCPAEALQLAAEAAIRLGFLIQERTTAGSPPTAPLRLPESLKAEASRPAQASRVRSAFHRIFQVLSEIEGAEGVRKSLADQLIAFGFDGREVRETRLDVSADAPQLVEDAEWLSASGEFENTARRARVLETVLADPSEESRRQLLARCVRCTPNWQDAVLALLAEALKSENEMPSPLEIGCAIDCALAGTYGDQGRQLGMDSLSRWLAEQRYSDSDALYMLLAQRQPAELIRFARSNIDRRTKTGIAAAVRIANDPRILADPIDRVRICAYLASAKDIDPDGTRLRQLIAQATLHDCGEFAETACEIRAISRDGGHGAAHTYLGFVATNRGSNDLAMRHALEGDSRHEFKSLNMFVLGEAQRASGQLSAAGASLEACLRFAESAEQRSTLELFGLRTDDVRCKLSQIFERLGNFTEAAKRYGEIEQSAHREGFAQRLAYLLYRSGEPARATALLRPLITRETRRIEDVRDRLNFCRSGCDDLAMADAAALAALRFPWCARFGSKDIPPLPATDRAARVSDGARPAGSHSQAASDPAVVATWREIADTILPLAKDSATSVSVALERLAQLQPIATAARYGHEERAITSIALVAAESSSARTSADSFLFRASLRRQPASALTKQLDDLNRHSCLRDELERHTRWAMLLVRDGRLSGTPAERAELATRLTESTIFRELDAKLGSEGRDRRASGEIDSTGLALAAVIDASGRASEAKRRMSEIFSRSLETGRTALAWRCLRLGHQPLASQWTIRSRILYVYASPSLVPKLVRSAQMLLLVIATLGMLGILSTSRPLCVSAAAWSILTIALSCGSALIWPIAPRDPVLPLLKSPNDWPWQFSAIIAAIMSVATLGFVLAVMSGSIAS